MKPAATNSFRVSRFSRSIEADHDHGPPFSQQAEWPVFMPSDTLTSLSPVLRDGVWRGAAEFVGTFALVFIGAGAVLSAGPLPAGEGGGRREVDSDLPPSSVLRSPSHVFGRLQREAAGEDG